MLSRSKAFDFHTVSYSTLLDTVGLSNQKNNGIQKYSRNTGKSHFFDTCFSTT